MLLWDGRDARPFWTGVPPIPQTCGSYLILIPKLFGGLRSTIATSIALFPSQLHFYPQISQPLS
ncbi:hypothetical protein [Microcoleus sp. D3_18_C2]|uniref:hypothetical protein n=1 Tax=Microcoleus sp. D3_18_C2 TaxID=3055334 RepID=UPI002FD0A1C5